MFTLKQIKNIAMEIKADGEWVNDSQTQSEYIGVCNGLNYLIDELEKIERDDGETNKKQKDEQEDDQVYWC